MKSNGQNVQRFDGRAALVTGGSRGIGRAIAVQLAGEGAHVVVSYLQAQDEAEGVVDEIKAAGGIAHVQQADVGDEAAVKELVRFTVRRLGGIDVLIANAGTVQDQLLGMMTVKQWDTVLGVNLRGPFLCIREALPFMMRKKSSSIVCLSSVAADKAGRGHSNYVAAKGGLNSMVRSLAVELAPKGVRVNAVAPGVIATSMSERVRRLAGDEILNQIPLQRFGEPDDVARAVCFLASDEASYVTGEILQVTGGFGL
ncbi:MAG: 3-oxoacyl-[acyl-carrier protein] reductase [Gaiellaceae bacterium]|jgi:3-oxoacyl-[acyl-carrier protein] reductase|nr:3-oxoacyl-[acyl-carrier protein] reductase [Gaiellaceae bacterium]